MIIVTGTRNETRLHYRRWKKNCIRFTRAKMVKEKENKKNTHSAENPNVCPMPNFIRLNIVLNHILWARLHSWDNAKRAHAPEVIFETAQMTKQSSCGLFFVSYGSYCIGETYIQSATEKKNQMRNMTT